MSTEKPAFAAPAESLPTDPIDRVIRYHVQTKHHFNRYARSLGYLDWANQPDPFRRFEGAPLVPSASLKSEEEPVRHRMMRCISEEAFLPAGDVYGRSRVFSNLLWPCRPGRGQGSLQWALRSNPSSGNLHPTEGYLVLPQIDGLDLRPGLYHYAPKEHGLELRAEFPAEQSRDCWLLFLLRLSFGLTSVHWREAWKYGERAFRYCNHDVGHAIGSARIAAATLGWKMALLDGSETYTAKLLGADRTEDFLDAEQEHPDCLAVIWPLEDVRRAITELHIPLFLDPAVVEKRCR